MQVYNRHCRSHYMDLPNTACLHNSHSSRPSAHPTPAQGSWPAQQDVKSSYPACTHQTAVTRHRTGLSVTELRKCRTETLSPRALHGLVPIALIAPKSLCQELHELLGCSTLDGHCCLCTGQCCRWHATEQYLQDSDSGGWRRQTAATQWQVTLSVQAQFEGGTPLPCEAFTCCIQPAAFRSVDTRDIFSLDVAACMYIHLATLLKHCPYDHSSSCHIACSSAGYPNTRTLPQVALMIGNSPTAPHMPVIPQQKCTPMPPEFLHAVHATGCTPGPYPTHPPHRHPSAAHRAATASRGAAVAPAAPSDPTQPPHTQAAPRTRANPALTPAAFLQPGLLQK